MTRTKKVLLALFAFEALCVGLFVSHLLAAQHKQPKLLKEAIVRLHNAQGHFVCSGTVVNDRTVVTAAHCIGGLMTGFFPPRLEFNVRAEDGKDTGLLGLVAGFHQMSDQAILIGDFSEFQTRPMVTEPREVIRLLTNTEARLIACGYPYGGKLYCSRIKNIRQFLFRFSADGYLFPGMSGGPVIDERTGSVIATNFAVTSDNVENPTRILINPTIEIFANTDTEMFEKETK